MMRDLAKPTSFFARIKRRINKARLPVALTLAICFALTLTVISTSIYYMAGFYRFDLSRPGYEKERKELVKSAPQKSYDTTSPLTPAALDDFLKDLNSEVQERASFNDFRDPALADNEIGVTPPSE